MKRLASLEVTLWSVLGLVVWFLLGLCMAVSQKYNPAFVQMNHLLVLDWIQGPAWDTPLLGIWFVVLALMSIVLGLNQALCLWYRLFPRLKNAGRFRAWASAILHVAFLVVMTCHVLSLVVGDKREDLRLTAGQSAAWGEHHRIEVKKIEFGDDANMFKNKGRQLRRLLTRDRFHTEKNWAEVELFKDGKSVGTGKIHILKPATIDGVCITLTRFRPTADSGLAVLLALTDNPLTDVFFTSYAVLIFTLLLLGILPKSRIENNHALEAEAA